MSFRVFSWTNLLSQKLITYSIEGHDKLRVVRVVYVLSVIVVLADKGALAGTGTEAYVFDGLAIVVTK